MMAVKVSMLCLKLDADAAIDRARAAERKGLHGGMSLSVYVTGLLAGLSLIVAIGAQNAFVLRQGLMGAHVFAVALACSLSDAALIALGVTSFRQIAVVAPWFLPAMRYGGAAFLIWYGARSLYSALRSSEALTAGDARASTLAQTLAMCLALTWLNPHVYLDTLMLLGAISTRFPGQEASFAAGAMTGSFLFFFSLGYGAKWLRPIFTSPTSWRVLEALIAVTMWAIALKLILGW
jgi:L-lysine exporter family protein LysE/ArgO